MTSQTWQAVRRRFGKEVSPTPSVIYDVDRTAERLRSGDMDAAAAREHLESVLSSVVPGALAGMQAFVGGANNIVLEAHAHDHARIYQQGSGTQHNG